MSPPPCVTRAGIPAGVLIASLMPGINDSPEQVEELLELVGEAGARSIGSVGLHLRGEVREIVFDWLRQYRPDLVPRYEELYRGGAYLRSDERKRLAALARRGRGIRGAGGMRALRDKSGSALERGPAGPRPSPTVSSAPSQSSLF